MRTHGGRLSAAAGLILFSFLGGVPPVIAQEPGDPSTERRDAAPIQVLVLGTYHFANPGRDAINPEAVDVTTPEKQAEIREVVDALGRFRPTRVVLEWPYEEASELDSLYREYLAGRSELTANERQQLGFRLAEEAGHERVYAADWHNEFGMDRVLAWAQEHDPSFVRYFEELRERILATFARLQRETTIGGVLRALNRPDMLWETYAPYMRMATVGSDSVYVGLRPVVNYYERNLRIFANVQRIAEPGDRILLIFGSGHAPFLRQFIAGHPEMELVDPLEYLPADD